MEPKFNPFTGAGRRLDGKPLKYEPAPASSSGSKDKKPMVTNGNAQPSTGSSSQATSRQAQGKLVFGGNANRAPKETQKVLLLFLLFLASTSINFVWNYITNLNPVRS